MLLSDVYIDCEFYCHISVNVSAFLLKILSAQSFLPRVIGMLFGDKDTNELHLIKLFVNKVAQNVWVQVFKGVKR